MADEGTFKQQVEAQQNRSDRPWQKDNKASTKPDVFTMYISPAEEPGDSSKVVKCRVSEQVVFSISNTYGPLFDSNKESSIGSLWQMGTGRSLAVQESSRQIWRGSTTGTFSFEIVFIANESPRTEVIDQIKSLYKLASPSGSGRAAKGSFLDKAWSSLLKPPGLVNIDIPYVLSLTNFYIQEVNFSQAMKLMRVNGKGPALPLSATGSITVVPEYMFLQEDIDFVFLGGTNEVGE